MLTILALTVFISSVDSSSKAPCEKEYKII